MANKKEIEVKWLKEKSGQKIGNISKVSPNMADFLVKKGDVILVSDLGSSNGNEGKINSEISSGEKDNKNKKSTVTNVTTVTDNTTVTTVTNNKSVTPVTPYTYIDKAFPDTIIGKVKKCMYYENNAPITLRNLAEKINEKYESLRVKISQNKVIFDEFLDENEEKVLQLLQPEFEKILENISQIEAAEQKREEEFHRKQRLAGRRENLILELKKFVELYHKEIERRSTFDEEVFLVDFENILEYDIEISEELLKNPLEIIESMELAFSDYFLIDGPCFVRIKNLPKIESLNIENFRAKHLGKLVSIEGRIVSTSDVRPQVVVSHFECPSCGTTMKVYQDEKKLKNPNKCSCGRRAGFKLLKEEMVNTARIILEDLQEKTDNPHASRLNCFLQNDLVNDFGMKILSPGNEVKVVGVLKKIPVQMSRGGISSRFEIAMDVNSIELCESEIDISKFTKKELREIKDLAKKVDIEGLEEINTSFAPHIFGHDSIKNAIILQLCSKRNTTGEGTRSKQNILMIGDPGTAKSELGKFTVKITPGSRVATGGGSSAVGITASVVREEGEGYRVEPGAMVIAREILFLDELNNLSDEDKPKLQEGMSEQKITINKANIHMSMKVTAGILAAANPISGLFKTSESLVKQYNLPAPIINRFDLIFSIEDRVNKKVDKSIAKSMINRDRGILKARYSDEFLKKFFVYIRSLKDPEINDKMVSRLQEIYSNLRAYKKEGININPRIHESILRILKSSAKIRMSNKIEEKDIERTINILSDSYYNIPPYEVFKPVEEELKIEGNSPEIKEAIDRYSKEQKEIEDSDNLGNIQ